MEKNESKGNLSMLSRLQLMSILEKTQHYHTEVARQNSNYKGYLPIPTSEIDRDALLEVYGFSENNWGDLSIFQGNFINYGYWKNIELSDDAELTVSQRIDSAMELYKLTAKYLNILPGDKVLEVGSGRGIGAMYINQEYDMAELTGIDFTPAQVIRANSILHASTLAGSDKINFQIGDAQKTSFENHYFDKVYSVEAIQHLSDVTQYATEMRRIIKPGGRIAISTYLHNEGNHSSQARKLLPLIDQHLENELTANQIKNAFIMAGFKWVDVHTIGDYVFPGYFKWALQVNAENKFTYNYIKAFNRKLINYYLIVAS